MNSTLTQGTYLTHFPQKGQQVQLDPSAFVADPELIQALEKRAISIPCDDDRVLFLQGDPPAGLCVLIKGEATVSMTGEDGEPLVSVLATSGSLLGLPGLIGNQPYSLTAIARRGAKVGFISRADFNTLMHSDPQLALKILQVLAAEVRSARLAITQQ
jgi:CRP-like cAMP-binding protein